MEQVYSYNPGASKGQWIWKGIWRSHAQIHCWDAATPLHKYLQLKAIAEQEAEVALQTTLFSLTFRRQCLHCPTFFSFLFCLPIFPSFPKYPDVAILSTTVISSETSRYVPLTCRVMRSQLRQLQTALEQPCRPRDNLVAHADNHFSCKSH